MQPTHTTDYEIRYTHKLDLPNPYLNNKLHNFSTVDIWKIIPPLKTNTIDVLIRKLLYSHSSSHITLKSYLFVLKKDKYTIYYHHNHNFPSDFHAGIGWTSCYNQSGFLLKSFYFHMVMLIYVNFVSMCIGPFSLSTALRSTGFISHNTKD